MAQRGAAVEMCVTVDEGGQDGASVEVDDPGQASAWRSRSALEPTRRIRPSAMASAS